VSLPHFFAGAPDVGGRVVLERDDARHAARSLRLGPGDRITSSDGRGAMALCRIVEADARGVSAEVEERTEREPPSPVLSVLLAPPKGDRLAWAIQKLTEVGTDRIVLIEAERSVRRWSGERAARALERARAVARAAAQQARRAFLPAVEGPRTWAEGLMEAASRGPIVVLWEGASEGLQDLLPEGPPELALVVGPEGGIVDEDAREAERRGALLASLGTNVLRTETAALAGASIALARYGRLGRRGEPAEG
jgi:16S rRNA (uracil1498-N3)-methyltransferase